MAQGDLTRAFSRRSKKEKERDERERACGSTSWPSICASGGECTGRGRGGAGRHPQESRRRQRRWRERERAHQSIFSNQFPRNIHHSSRSKHTNPVFTYRSEVERRVVPHLSRPGGVLMRRRLAAVGRAWRRGVSLPWRRAVARGGRRAARGRRRPAAVPRSGVLGLGGGSFQSADANQEVSPRRGCRRREEAAVGRGEEKRGGGAAAASGRGTGTDCAAALCQFPPVNSEGWKWNCRLIDTEERRLLSWKAYL